MCDIQEEPPKDDEPPKRLMRNGMDYEPKKTYPPDYSNVPSVRDWQMSPFGNERFDLDEIQRAEKKGYKGRYELEQLLKRGEKEPEVQKSACQICAEREKAEEEKKQKQKQKSDSCESDEYMYQPYGPNVVSTMSYSKPESNKPRMYTYMGPSSYAGYKPRGPDDSKPVACQDLELEKRNRNFKNVYIPYGPKGEIRISSDMYVPMGPSIAPISDE